MNLPTILGIAVALAMDAFAVAIATGVSLKRVSFRQTFRLSWHFGLFQAMMPIIGWGFGASVQRFMAAYAHWVAFFLVALVGSNMLREAILADEDEEEEIKRPRKDATRGMTLVMLSVATSIDALAVGLSLALIGVNIWTPALVIGLTASTLTVAGMLLGAKIGMIWGKRVEVLGGLVLIGIVAGLFTIAGLHLGKRVARLTWLSTWAEIVGGLVLWLIGLNILRESGVFSTLF